MKAPVKVRKMILIDYQKYMNLLRQSSDPTQNSTVGTIPIDSSHSYDPLSIDSKLELDSYMLRNKNRMKHESMKNQESEIANLTEQLNKLKTQTNNKSDSNVKKVDMSTGTDDELKTYVDKGTSANPTTSDASTQITYKHGEYPGYLDFLEKSPKKEERVTRDRGNPYERGTASTSKLHIKKSRVKSVQTGAGGWYRMPFE